MGARRESEQGEERELHGSAASTSAAMLSLRGFMFEHVYLGPETRPELDRAREAIGRIYEHLQARGDSQGEIVEFIAGMTDRFALSYAEAL